MNTIIEQQEFEIISELIKNDIKSGKTRAQIYDYLYDPDYPPRITLANKFMKVYDTLYPPITKQEEETNEAVKAIEWRFGQEVTYNKWCEWLDTAQTYWGVVIAPTGWGKSFMTMIMIGAFLLKYPGKNVLYITKRKDVLSSQFSDKPEPGRKNEDSDFIKSVKQLIALTMYPKGADSHIYNMFDEVEGLAKYNSDKSQNGGKFTNSLFIYNADKLRVDSKQLTNILKQDIGLLIFDEMHWSGAFGINETVKLIKEQVPFAIGFSATPVRAIPENQRRTYNLFGDGSELNILHEITYLDGWEHKFILPVKHYNFPIDKQDLINDSQVTPDCKVTYKISTAGHKTLLHAISDEIWMDKLHFKKAIMYFETRERLVDFYCKVHNGVFNDIPIITDCIRTGDIGKIYMSFSYQSGREDSIILDRLDTLGIRKKYIDTGIDDFKRHEQNALLLVVGRAVEGFDDYRVEMVINMDYVESRNALTTLQKIGRAQRIPKDCDLALKPCGYYVCPVKKTETRQEQCSYIASLTNDYLSVVCANLLDGDNSGDDGIESGGGGGGSSQAQEDQIQKIKSIIEQNLYLHDGYEISAEDILREIRALNFREIRSAGRLARFCQEYKITSPLEYHKFRNENMHRFNLRPNANDYPGFGWWMVLDPRGTIYYPSREVCIEKINIVDTKFQIDYSKEPNTDTYEELYYLRRYQKIKFLNQLDSKIPNMSLDDYYGRGVNK